MKAVVRPSTTAVWLHATGQKPRSVCLSEQAVSLFLHNTQQIIGNLQMINILYLLFITLPVIHLDALSVTAILSFPE